MAFARCASSSKSIYANLEQGAISFPFVKTIPLGANEKPKKFIIKTIKGSTQYVVEIPDAGEEYDIEIPMAALSATEDEDQYNVSPEKTDQELTASLPSLSKVSPARTAFVDKAFGVADSHDKAQLPSYTLGLAKISRLFKKSSFEYALIEVNNLLTYYPHSPKLYKMKGSIYLKMGNFKLAQKAWKKALELTPQDKSLRKGLAVVDRKIKDSFDTNYSSDPQKDLNPTNDPQLPPDGSDFEKTQSELNLQQKPMLEPASNIIP